MTTRPRKRVANERPPAAPKTVPEAPQTAVEPLPELPAPTNVIEALARVQRELGGIARLTPQQRQAAGMQTGSGDTGISYAYRGIDQIAAAVQPLFGKYGIVLLPWVETYDVVDITVRNNPWTDHTMTILWTIYGPGGKDDWISARTIGLGRDNSDKGANKAMTGAHKNLLLKLLSIGDPHDDPDNERVESTPPPRAAEQPDPRTPSEIGVRDAVAKMSDDQRKRFVESFVNQFGKRLLDLEPEKHKDALAWTSEWVEHDTKGTEPEKDDPVKPLPDGADGGRPGHVEPIAEPELGEVLTEALDENAAKQDAAAPAEISAMEPIPDGCDFVGMRCMIHKRAAAECRAQYGGEP